jgi:membrane-bound lytic murein transglycosylase MltF
VQSDQLIPMLLQGRADMIAARMTITPERERRILFSRPYRQVDEQLLTHRDLEDIDTLEDLSGRTVAVRDSSSYRESLQMESERLVALGKPPIQIELVDSALETENILALVAAGHFDFTLADSIMAETAVEIFPTLRVVSGQALRKGGQLAWATHPGATGLKQEMDEFLLKYRQGTMHGNAAVNKYFQDIAGLADRVQSDGPVTLSPYDEEIRRVAEHYCFDWRLMAAVAYQESRFKQHAHNPSGATGLFQIKPQTAAEPYIDVPDIAGDENAANNIRAGIKYIAWIKGRYFDSVPEMREGDRMRMTLAAYNAGPRTVRRAQHRAESMGLDRTRWFRHVELGMLDLNRAEPVKYVSEINQHYLSYLMLGVKRSAGPQGERRDAPMRPGDTSKRNDCPASP